MIEVTGAVEFGARVVLDAIEHHKHVILMNAELDGTLGPILRVRAERAGVVYSASDGDQPGVQMNLFRFVQSIGITPLLCGNIKGLHDPYRNPTTQEGFARRWGQNPYMVTSFADGTKISLHALSPLSLRGPAVRGAGGALQRRGDGPCGRAPGRGGGHREGGHFRGNGDRRDGRLPHLRAVRGRGDGLQGPAAADGRRRGLSPCPRPWTRTRSLPTTTWRSRPGGCTTSCAGSRRLTSGSQSRSRRDSLAALRLCKDDGTVKFRC